MCIGITDSVIPLPYDHWYETIEAESPFIVRIDLIWLKTSYARELERCSGYIQWEKADYEE